METTTDGQNEVVHSEENQDASSTEGHVGEDDNNKGKGRGAGASIPVADNDEQEKSSSGPKVRYIFPLFLGNSMYKTTLTRCRNAVVQLL